MFYPDVLPATAQLPPGVDGTRVPVVSPGTPDSTHEIQVVVFDPERANKETGETEETEETEERVLLYAHGNAGHLCKARCAMLQRIATALACTVVGFDYRGFGLSSPRGFAPTESSILQDGAAALGYAHALALSKNARVWVWGESMGSAVAAHLASDPRVAGVVMHIAFARLVDVATHTAHRTAALGRWRGFFSPGVVSAFVALLDDPLDNAAKLAAPRAASVPAAMIVAKDDELMAPDTANALERALRQHAERPVLRVDVEGTHGAHSLESALPAVAMFVRQAKSASDARAPMA
jgi:pimeloyl-ACP methyl ester carboxylesterase